jgi:hypothetical protein
VSCGPVPQEMTAPASEFLLDPRQSRQSPYQVPQHQRADESPDLVWNWYVVIEPMPTKRPKNG